MTYFKLGFPVVPPVDAYKTAGVFCGFFLFFKYIYIYIQQGIVLFPHNTLGCNSLEEVWSVPFNGEAEVTVRLLNKSFFLI